MMAFAQTNYNEIQGINGRFSIHDIGCFLTSFSNLELDYNKAISPLDINNQLRDRNLFIDVDDGVRDDVDWGFITYIDPDTRVSRRGSGGWPNTNQSIVKFAYISPRTQKPETHFCKVADCANQMILDSWDGTIKHVSSTWYGQPVEWAVYEHGPVTLPTPTITVTPFATPQQFTISGQLWNLDQANFEAIASSPVSGAPTGPVTITAYLTRSDLPQYVYYLPDANTHHGYNKLDCTPYTPPPAPYVAPAGGLTVPKAQTYDLLTTVKYYTSADNARKDFDARGVIDKGTYILVKSDGTARQLAKKNTDITSYWINNFDNKADMPSPAPLPVTLPVATSPVTPLPVIAPATTLSSVSDIAPVTPTPKTIDWDYLTADKQALTYRYKGTTPVPIKDLQGIKPSVTLTAGSKGKFSRYARVGTIEYLLPDKEFNQGNFYGIPMQLMEEVQENILQEAEQEAETWGAFLENGFKSARQFISDITPAHKQALKQHAVQFIDGFKKGKK